MSEHNMFIELGEDMLVEDLVRIINDGGSKANKIIEYTYPNPIIGGQSIFDSNYVTNPIAATFDSYNNKLVIIYLDSPSSLYLKAVVGTVSGSSISFGTPVTFHTSSFPNFPQASVAFDSSNNKIVVAYAENSMASGAAVVGTVSGSSISFGSAYTFDSNTVYAIHTTFDSYNNKIVIVYRNSTSKGAAIVGTVSGSSISFGSAVVFTTVNIANNEPVTVFDSYNNKIVTVYGDTDLLAKVGTVSGSSISFGDAVVITSSWGSSWDVAFDSFSNKILVVYSSYADNKGRINVGAVSGSSISFGSAITFDLETVIGSYKPSVISDGAGNIIVAYTKSSNGDGKIMRGFISGNSTQFNDSPVTFESGNAYLHWLTFDDFNNKAIIVWTDNNKGAAKTISIPAPICGYYYEDTIGILQESGSAGETKEVTLFGGVSSVHSGLVPGQKLYIQENCSIGTAFTPYPLGTAISGTEILLDGFGMKLHGNEFHENCFITVSGVTFENLDSNGDVGSGLNQVAAGNHVHDDRYYTESEIDSVLAGKSDIGHVHIESDITDLDKYTQSEIDTQMAGKSDIGHLHDDRYYTETETDSLLDGKSDIGHIHDDRYYTEIELDIGQLDNRYYTESEIDGQLSALSSSLSTEIDSDIDTHNASTSAHQNLVKIVQCYNDTTTDINQATAIAIPWNGEDFKDGIFTHSTVTDNSRITFDNEGIYEIQYFINGDNTGNNRVTVGSHIRVNGSTVLDRGRAYSFSRDAVDDKATCNASLFFQATVDDYIEIMCGQAGGSGTVNTIPLQSWISIKLIRYL